MDNTSKSFVKAIENVFVINKEWAIFKRFDFPLNNFQDLRTNKDNNLNIII